MAVKRSYEEINEKIRRGEAVVVTAEEVIEVVAEKGYAQAARSDKVAAIRFSICFLRSSSDCRNRGR